MGDSYLVGAVVSVCVVCDRLTPLPVRASGSTARWAFLRMYEEPGAHLLKAAALPRHRLFDLGPIRRDPIQQPSIATLCGLTLPPFR